MTREELEKEILEVDLELQCLGSFKYSGVVYLNEVEEEKIDEQIIFCIRKKQELEEKLQQIQKKKQWRKKNES